MVKLEERVIVPRRVSDVFRYVADFSTIEQWDPGVYRAEKLTPGEPREGSEFSVVLSNPGKPVEMVYRLEEVRPGERVVLRGTSRVVDARDVIEFQALDGEQTSIRYEAELTFHGAQGAVLSRLTPWLNQVGKAAVRGLERALTPEEEVQKPGVWQALKRAAVLPAAWEFTERGYLGMENKGLSEFIDGKVVVITGPTSGLGLAAACELARLGGRLILLGRTPSKLDAAVEKIRAFSGCEEAAISVVEVDLSLMSEVRRAAAEVQELTDRVDVLIHNAGALFDERQETEEGHERTLAIHLLCPFVLTKALEKQLLRGERARVIAVSSGGMYTQGLRLDDMEYRKGGFDGAKAYARAKRGQVGLLEHWAETLDPSDVSFFSMHPGWAATPGVARSLPRFNRALEGKLRDSRMGADTVVWLATSRALRGQTGGFYFDRKPRPQAVFPGTAVSADDGARLAAWLEQVTR